MKKNFRLCIVTSIVLIVSACGIRNFKNSNISSNIEQTKNIAIIGDSQTAGDYGKRLAERIIYNSSQKLVYFGGASSARIHHWIDGGFTAIPSNAFRSCQSGGNQSCKPTLTANKQTQSIKSIMNQYPKIDSFIITLGDNHYYDPNSTASFTQELVEEIISAGRKCAFITPTIALGKFKDKSIMLAGIKQGIEKVRLKHSRTCLLIDSYTFGSDVIKTNPDRDLITKSLQADSMGLHPSGVGAKLWADRVFDKLLAERFLD